MWIDVNSNEWVNIKNISSANFHVGFENKIPLKIGHKLLQSSNVNMNNIENKHLDTYTLPVNEYWTSIRISIDNKLNIVTFIF